MEIKAKVIAVTNPVLSHIPNAENLMAYCARVSNPSNQDNHQTADKLLAYCFKHNHWSVFEMVNVIVELEAPRDISRQLLRHRSNQFQEFSQRYAEVTDEMFCYRELRTQDHKNRQNSLETDNEIYAVEWMNDQQDLLNHVKRIANKWKDRDIAKEVLRVIYPEGLTMSRMYINFNIRSLIHYIQVRSSNGTQKEHTEIAQAIYKACEPYFPNTLKAILDEQTY